MANSATRRAGGTQPVLRTVIFDVGGVCFTNGTQVAIHRLAAMHGLRQADLAVVLSGPLGSEYRMGKISSEDFWSAACKSWGITADSDLLNRIWHSSYQKIPGTFSLLGRLRDAGHELLYLSDNVPERVDYLETRYRFMQFFSDGIFSYQAKLRKPDPRIYNQILGKASRPAHQCVYIDDVKEFLVPARQLGIVTIQFRGPRRLGQELRLLNLL